MKRTQFLKSIILPASLLALSAIPAFAQSAMMKPQELEARARELKVEPAELKVIRAAAAKPGAFNGWGVVQEFTGNFESVAKNYDEFSREFRDQKLQAKAGEPALLILLEDPTGKSEFRYLVGYTVGAKLEPKAPLQPRQIEHRDAVRYTHVGPYDRLENIHGAVKASVREIRQKETEFPVVLRLLNDPRKVGPAERKTEMIVPVS